MNSWTVAGLFVLVAVIFLGFCLLIWVGISDNMVYPIDDMGTTSVENVLYTYINPLYAYFELPFLVISAGVGLAIGSRAMSKGWKVVGGWAILALTLLGVCLYTTLSFLTYDWIYQLVPQNIAPWSPSGIDTHMFIQMAISNATVLSRYFWTAFGFVIAGLVAGLLGSRIGRRT